MPAQSGAKPGGSVAEAFADVATPGGTATADIGTGQLILAPFRAPAEFTASARSQFGRKNAFPAPAGLVREPDPREVKNLVDQDALEFAGLDQEFGIEKNAAARNVGGGEMGAERTPQLDANGTAGEGRQQSLPLKGYPRYCFGGAAGSAPGKAPALKVLKKSESLMIAW